MKASLWRKENTNSKIDSISTILCLFHSSTNNGGAQIQMTKRPSSNKQIEREILDVSRSCWHACTKGCDMAQKHHIASQLTWCHHDTSRYHMMANIHYYGKLFWLHGNFLNYANNLIIATKAIDSLVHWFCCNHMLSRLLLSQLSLKATTIVVVVN